ncbi:type II CAAX endopeptidase family protein [Sphingomonas sp. dw_22]|uniref:CPBP family intramembrane glutamic endopeptidase n=1 Tax=Sphingomonas sp. dw_22 TaxID=2721175 RepID=UPI001BD2B42A|nr:type II CAAX endopeptidase family protein [Sphingomonas sp. dw_22]
MKARAIDSTAGAFVLLAATAVAALSVILGAQFVFGRILENPGVAAWSPVLLESLFTIAVFGILGGIAGLAVRRFGGRAGAGPAAAVSAGVGVVAGAAGLGIAIALSALAGVAHAGEGGGAGALLLAGAVVTLIQTGAEELYFRGWLQPHLESGWGRWPGLAVTALAFAALHFVSGAFEWLSFVNLVLAGLWFGLLAQRSGGLALPIGAHFGWNWAEEMLFGATPNPGVSSFGTVFDWDLTGSPLWGGSSEGLNASLSASFVLIALVIVAASWRGFSSPGRRG